MLRYLINKVNKPLIRLYYRIFPKRPWYDFYDGVSHHLDYPDISIYELIEKTASNYPFSDALLYYGKRITYNDLIIRIKKAAASFLSIGVKNGDRVTICMPNTPSAIISFYALNMIGATSNMVHPLSGEKEIEKFINDSMSKYILVIDLAYQKILNIKDNTSLKKIIICKVSDDMNNINQIGYFFLKGYKNNLKNDDKSIFWNDFIKLGVDYKKVSVFKKDISGEAVILYSGGTTGSPKGIILSDKNFNALALQSHVMCDPSKAGDSILSIMPIFHGFGLGVCIHTPLYVGMKCILVPDFNYKKFAKLIKKYRPNFLVGVPTLFSGLINSDVKDLSFVRCVVSGGDNLALNLKRSVDEFLQSKGSNAKIREGYGLTESTGASCLTPSRHYRENSIGIPFPDMIYKIVKIGTVNRASNNILGEICISGPTVMIGYLNNEEETKKTLKLHNDGLVYLHTGDVGFMDDNGFVYLKDRIKRVVISSGYNIYPGCVEEVLMMHDAIFECAVVGISHPYKSNVIKAYIVLNDGFFLNDDIRESIVNHCKLYLSKFSLPYEYEFVDSIPHTAVGKIDYKKLSNN